MKKLIWAVIQASIFHEISKLFLQKVIVFLLHLQQFQLWQQAWTQTINKKSTIQKWDTHLWGSCLKQVFIPHHYHKQLPFGDGMSSFLEESPHLTQSPCAWDCLQNPYPSALAPENNQKAGWRKKAMKLYFIKLQYLLPCHIYKEDKVWIPLHDNLKEDHPVRKT